MPTAGDMHGSQLWSRAHRCRVCATSCSCRVLAFPCGAQRERCYPAVSFASITAHTPPPPPAPASCPTVHPGHSAASSRAEGSPQRPPDPVPYYTAHPGYCTAGTSGAVAASHKAAAPGAAPPPCTVPSAPGSLPPQEGLSLGVPMRTSTPSLPRPLAPCQELAGLQVMSGLRSRQALPRCDLAKVQARGLCPRPAWKPPRALRLHK